MDLLSFLQSVRSRLWIGYTAALILPVGACAVRSALSDVFVGYPFVTYLLAVVLVAVIGTKSSAAFATLLSVILAYYVNNYNGSISQGNSAWIGITLFSAVCGVVIVVVHELSSILLRLAQTQGELATLNEELEQRIADRTQALQAARDLLVLETEAKVKAEEQVRQSQKMETIGLMTGGIAHDFNNMLSVIAGSLDLIRRRVATGSTDITQHLDNATDGLKRSAALTQQLLSFSRKQPLAPTILDINDRVAGMEELLRRTLGSNVTVRVIKGVDLWTIRADACQLENAILNLAINARDAMPSGGVLTIETMNAQGEDVGTKDGYGGNGEFVVLSVSDTGVGMSDEVKRSAFEPFFTTKPLGEGTGLGLSQIYGFIKQSGGYVTIHSTIGVGTTIKLCLPRHTTEPAL